MSSWTLGGVFLRSNLYSRSPLIKFADLLLGVQTLAVLCFVRTAVADLSDFQNSIIQSPAKQAADEDLNLRPRSQLVQESSQNKRYTFYLNIRSAQPNTSKPIC